MKPQRSNEFTINFGQGKSKMRIGLYTNNYKDAIENAKSNYLLIQEYDHFSVFLDEGTRVTLIDCRYLDLDKEIIKSKLKETWEGDTESVFSILYTMFKSIQEIK